MTEIIELLRDAVIAEIELALASLEEGSDGYRRSTPNERKLASEAWEKLSKKYESLL